VPIKETPSLALASPDGLFGVGQAFTWQTAPVKRLERLGMYWSGHRTANRPLIAPRQFPAADAGAAGGASTGSPMGESGTPAQPGGGTPASPGGAEMGERGSSDSPGGPKSSGGAQNRNLTESGLVKDRYIHVTEQVRRMPVALTVTVDQAYINNVISAFT